MTSEQKKAFRFTFSNLRNEYESILALGYRIMTCADYANAENSALPKRTLVNRIDIDISVKKAERIGQILNDLKIRGTFFVRLHGPEYNPFSFDNYRVLKFLRDSGHEIGYHSEVVDEAEIWHEDAAECLRRDLRVMETMLGVKVKGVASHGGRTGWDNLAFWQARRPSDFGLSYEAYDREPTFGLFSESLYVSDSEWTQWKCYQNGVLATGDRRSLAEHAHEGPPLIYLLIHSDTYFDDNCYEE